MTSITELFPYQLEDATWLSKQKRAGLFHQVGLGKSYISLGAAKLAHIKNIAVICPKVMIPTWEKDLKEWGFKGYVCNYDKLSRNEFKLPTDTQLIIADEAQALKAWSAKRTRVFYKDLAASVPYVWMLTATPLSRSAADLHPILSFCRPGKFGTFRNWQEKYCFLKVMTIRGKTIRSYYGAQRTSELNGFLKDIGIRRTKAEVLPDLPKMLYTDIPVSINKTLVAECLNIPLNVIQEGLQSGSIPTHLASLIKAIGVSKVPSTVDYIVDQFDNTPLVVFFLHTQVGLNLQDMLRAEGKKVGLIYGSTSLEQRNKQIIAFQNGEYDVLLLNTYAAGVGITLTKASHCIHVEPVWSAALYEQSNGRIDRISQQASCLNCYNMIAKGTTDELVIRTLVSKKVISKEILQ